MRSRPSNPSNTNNYALKIMTIFVTSLLAHQTPAFADDKSELEALRALVQDLDQKIKVLSRKSELAEEDTANAKKNNANVKASSNGFSISSPDGKNEFKLRGVLQADYRGFDDGVNDIRGRTNTRAGSLDADGFSEATDTSLLRRVRPTFEGTLLGKYGFRFTPDFGGGGASVIDAHIDANLTPWFKIRAGKFKSFVGLERLQSASDIRLVERSYVTNAILPNRDLGIAVHGDFFDNKLNYAVGLVNGVADGGNIATGVSFTDEKEVTARLFATPFRDDVNILSGLGFGLAGTYTDFTGERNLDFTGTSNADSTRNGLPSYVTEGQQTFFRYGSAAVADGQRLRIAPQAYYYHGPFGLIAEYAQVKQDVSLLTTTASNTTSIIAANTHKGLTHEAYNLTLSYLLTGEDSSFKGVKPANDFDLDRGGWGAWEVVARFSGLNLDDDTFRNPAGTAFTGGYADLSQSAKSASTWIAGLNWYWNTNVKFQLNYAHTSFDGGAVIGASNNAAGTTVTTANASGSNIKDRPDEKAIFARFQISY